MIAAGLLSVINSSFIKTLSRIYASPQLLILKKPSLYLPLCSKYGPIAKLLFTAKLGETTVYPQLLKVIRQNTIYRKISQVLDSFN